MHRLGGRKIFIFGFIAVLLIGIPVTIYLVQKQQETRSHAEKSTNVSFLPESSASAPITKNVGDSIPLEITVDPGKNLVSFVKLEIQYDPDKLATASPSAFVQNATVFPSVLEGPIFTPGKIAVTLSVGPDPTKSIQTKVKAATVTFKALKSTPPGTPTLVSYGATTQVLSIGSNDQASENVLSSATPATIVIGGPAAVISPTVPVPTEVVPTAAVTPTEVPSVIPTSLPTPVPTSVPTTVVAPPSANQAPICTSLALDKSTGNAPLAVTFTANGTDADGTINKVTFNYGDGQVSDVTTGGGIGTAATNVTSPHSYSAAGTFTAQALVTDDKGGVSDSASCKQTVTVTASGSPALPTPTIAPTGASDVAIGIGAVILTFIVGGGFLFFFL